MTAPSDRFRTQLRGIFGSHTPPAHDPEAALDGSEAEPVGGGSVSATGVAPTAAAPSAPAASAVADAPGAPVAPAPAPASAGIITSLPGFGASAPEKAATEHPRVAHAGSADDGAGAADDLDETRLRSDLDLGGSAPLIPERAVVGERVRLVFDDGRTADVDEGAVIGRNPSAEPERGLPSAIVVVDQSRTVSKAHLEVRIVPTGLELVDRGSTNGSSLEPGPAAPRGATIVTLEPSQRVVATVGDTVRLGDRWFVIEELVVDAADRARASAARETRTNPGTDAS